MVTYHKLYRVIGFALAGDYKILVRFDDATEQTIDFEPVLHGEMWGPLRDRDFFEQVSLDPIAHTLTWPNGADFDPETLRNWSDYSEELAKRAKSWSELPVQ